MRAISDIAATAAVGPACPHSAQEPVPAAGAADLAVSGRALALVETTEEPSALAATRPAATFLAQLIATAEQMPQTRKRRRAEPSEVTTLYEAAATPAAWIGGAVYRSL